MAGDANMDVDYAAIGAAGDLTDSETFRDTVDTVTGVETTRQRQKVKNKMQLSLFRRPPRWRVHSNRRVTFVNLTVECLNNQKSEVGFLTYLASFEFICLTDTFVESVDLSLTELKEFLCFVAIRGSIFLPSTGVMMSEFVTKAKMKVTLMFNPSRSLGRYHMQCLRRLSDPAVCFEWG